MAGINPSAGGATGVSPLTTVAAKIDQSENSTGNPAAQPLDPKTGKPLSTASGNGQFIDQTWLNMMNSVAPDVAKTMPKAQQLALRNVPAFALAMTEEYAKQNADVLSKANVPVSEASLDLAHRFGPQGAIQIMQAKPDAALSSVLPKNVIQANPSLAKMTAGQLQQSIDKQFSTDPMDMSGGAANPTFGRFNNPQTIEVDDGGGEPKQVLAQQNKATGQWVSADDKRTPVKGNVVSIVPQTAGASGRNAINLRRVLIDAKDASSDLGNLANLPVTSDAGFFGNRGAEASSSLFTSTKDVLANHVTPQEVQDYNTTAVGLGRALAGLETGGLQVNQGLMQQFEKLQLQDGDTQFTKMRKLATMRQNATNAIETLMADPSVPRGEQKLAQGILDSLQKSIPWSPADVTKLEYTHNPQTTLRDVANASGLGGAPPPVKGSASSAGQAAPVKVKTPDDAMKLAPGTYFETPDGRIKVR
jgi:hypothetical protein